MPSSLLRRVLAPAALLLCGAACATRPVPAAAEDPAVVVDARPGDILLCLRGAAIARGGRVVEETADTLVVDFGTRVARVPVRTRTGLWSDHVVWHETEVHDSTRYRVEPWEGGARVTVQDRPIFWHPALREWHAVPSGAADGPEALTRTALLE